MTSDAILVLRTLFTSIWSLFTSWIIPGTHATPLSWALFLIVSAMSIKFIKHIGIKVNQNDDEE